MAGYPMLAQQLSLPSKFGMVQNICVAPRPPNVEPLCKMT